MRKGRLEVVSGCMNSGKSEEAMRRVRMHGQRRKIFAYIWADSARGEQAQNFIHSRNGAKMKAMECTSLLRAPEPEEGSVVVIDEGQFFSDLFAFVEQSLDRNCVVIVSGLPLNYKGEPFGQMLELHRLQPEKHKSLTALCSKCESLEAIHSGKWGGTDAEIEIGDGEIYLPLCRACFSIRHSLGFK